MADTKCLHIPVDFESRISFRLLEREVGKAHAAALLVFLWRELAYAAESHQVGFLPDDQVPLLEESADFLEEPVQRLNGNNGLLARQNDGYFCSAFATANKHLSADYVSMQAKGGIARSVSMKKKRIEQETTQTSLLLDRELFVRPDGDPMDTHECNQVVMIVRLFDNYLGRRQRLNSEFAPGMIQDAYQALKRYNEEAINRVCRWIYLNREKNHPGVPRNTEQVLQDFDRYVKASESVA